VSQPPDQKQASEPGSGRAPRTAIDGRSSLSTEEAVKRYIARHPELVRDDPALLARLVPESPRGSDTTIVDIRDYAIKRLQQALSEHEREHEAMLDAARANSVTVARIHGAVLGLMEARSFEDLIARVTQDMAARIDADAVALCVESQPGQPLEMLPRASVQGVRVLSPGEIDRLMGAGVTHLLQGNIMGDPVIFGDDAPVIRAQALLRLRFARRAPPGILAFGATDPAAYHPDQGVELLDFLARALERAVRLWLDEAHTA
jgi:uncharacterized protein YigA (DUF484 family)